MNRVGPVEPSDSGEGDGNTDERLDVGPRMSAVAVRVAMFRVAHPRGVGLALATLVVLVVVLVVVAGVAGVGGSARPQDASRANHADQPKRPPPARVMAIEQVQALTEHAGPLTDYVRQTAAAGACAQVAPGQSPGGSIEVTLTAALPGLRVVAISRTLDQFSGLCALQLRAVEPNGVVLGLVVSSPTDGDRVRPYIRSGHDSGLPRVTSYVQSRDGRGWVVLLGVTGAGDRLPRSAVLRRIVRDPRLIW